MRILPLHKEIEGYLKQRGLSEKFKKQKALFERNPFHPSLNTELLEPRSLRLWSFRIDRRYRAVFIFRDRETAEVIDINNHYRH